MTRSTALLLTWVVLLLTVAPGARAASPQLAQAPADPGVGELWEEYPLEDGRAPGATPEPPSDADGTVTPQASPDAASQASPPQAPSSTPVPADQTPAVRADGDGGSGGASLSATLIALLLVALVVVDVLVFLRVRRARRRRRQATAYPVWGHSSNVYAEGSTDRDGIGSFRGLVFAMETSSKSGADRMLGVQDPGRDEPVWVLRSEVDSLSSGASSRPVGAVADSKRTATASSPSA